MGLSERRAFLRAFDDAGRQAAAVGPSQERDRALRRRARALAAYYGENSCILPGMRKKTLTETLMLRLSPEDAAKLRETAGERGQSVSSFARWLLRRALGQTAAEDAA